MRMPVEQIEFEKNVWRRLVEFIQLESSYCKDRLAEIIKANSAGTDFLEQAEYYQNYYIQQDAHLLLLKHDLNTFARLADREKFEDGLVANQLLGMRHRLKREIGKLDDEFRDMRLRFNNFVEANM